MKRAETGRRLCSTMKFSDLKYEVEDKDEISCNACMSVAFHPLQCNVCESIFCEECFKSFYAQVTSCPLGCPNPPTSNVSEEILKKVRECVFVCQNKINGCTQDVPYDEVVHHDLTCAFKLVKCSGYKLCKISCLRMDLYAHESLCPYSEVNRASEMNNAMNNNVNSLRCRNCVLCKNGSKCYDNLYDLFKFNQGEVADILKSLISQIKRQDDEIKELKIRLNKMEDGKEELCVDLQKLNHNVNTQINLEVLTQSQQLESAGWLGAQHYANIKKCLPDFRDFYEHEEWRMHSNLGYLQVFTKNSGENGVVHILARAEFKHSINDIADEITNGNILIKDDSNTIASDVVQKIGDNMSIYYSKFSKFLAAEQCDIVCLCQRIQNPAESEDKTVVFPFISNNHFKKKPEAESERLELRLGGWVLKHLGSAKTLVNLFFNIKFPKSVVPEVLTGKHIKSLLSMMRTLDSSLSKLYNHPRLGTKIYERTSAKDRVDDFDPNSERKQDEEEEDKYEETPEIDLDTPNDSKESCTRVQYPNDIPRLNPDKINSPYKEHIIGTRSRVNELVDLINTGSWKYIKSKNEMKIFVRKSERGYICVKGETYFPFEPERIIDYLRKVDTRKEYDEFTESAQIIEELPHRTFLAYAKIKKILVVASRDITFVSQIVTSKKTKTMYTPTYSIVHPDFPPQKDPIRAEVFIGGWVMIKKGEGCQVIYASEIDLKGSIPKFLVEKSADIQVMVVTGLRNYMEKMEKSNPEAIPQYPKEDEEEEEVIQPTPKTPIHHAAPEPLIKQREVEELKPSKSAQLEDELLEEEKRPSNKSKAGDNNKNKKGQSCQELGIDTYFAKFKDEDIEEKINTANLDPETAHHVIRSRQSVFDLIKEIDGPYKQLKSQKKIDIYVRDNGKESQSVLGVGEIPYSIEKILEVLVDEKQRKNFDDMLEDGIIEKRLEHMTFIIYITFKRFLILSPRDFICCGCLVKFNDGTAILPVYSIESEDRPENKKYIRAQLHIGGWVLKRIDDNNTYAYYYNRADMKGTCLFLIRSIGSIPDFVIKQGASVQALLIAKLRDYMIKIEKKASK